MYVVNIKVVVVLTESANLVQWYSIENAIHKIFPFYTKQPT